MTLRIDTHTLDELGRAGIGVVVAAVDEARARPLLQREGCANGHVAAFVFEPGSDGSAGSLRSLASSGQQFACLNAPPGGRWIMAALSPCGAEQLEQLASWWSQRGDVGSLAVTKLYEEGNRDGAVSPQAEPLDRLLLHIALEEARRSAAQVTELQAQLYELRSEYERARFAMQAMQQHLERVRQVPIHLIQVLPPDGSVFRPDANRARLIQPLPMGAEGLAGFDLFVASAAAGADGCLTVRVVTRGTEQSLGAWRFYYSELKVGSLRCFFSRVLQHSSHYLSVIVEWETQAGPPAALSLSAIGPWHELSAECDGRAIDAALAIHVWAGLAGAALPCRPAGLVSTGGQGAEHIEFELSAADLARIRPTAVSSLNFFHVFPEGGFRLHPIDDGLASACLRRACPAGTARVTVVGQIRNKQAAHVIEYAMCLTDAASSCSPFPPQPEADARVLGYSNWLPVPPDDQPHALCLSVDGGTTRPADLHFATRVAGGESNAYAWADWLEVRVALQGDVAVTRTCPTDTPT